MKFIFNYIFGILLSAILLSFFLSVLYYSVKPPYVDAYGSNHIKRHNIYQIIYGRVDCQNFEVLPCGIHLSGCADLFEYFCLENVRYEIE